MNRDLVVYALDFLAAQMDDQEIFDLVTEEFPQLSQRDIEELSNEIKRSTGDYCPKCGGGNIQVIDGPGHVGYDQVVQIVACLDCHAAWNETFTLTEYITDTLDVEVQS